jgi:hypothetical protein
LSKRAITIVSLSGIVFLIIAFVGFGPAFATQLRSCQGAANQVSCLTSASSAVTIGFVLYLIGALAALAAWIMGLFKTARIGRWGWFVAVLFTFALGSLLYGVAGPTTRANA